MLMTSGTVSMMNMRMRTKERLILQGTESITRSTARKILKQRMIKKQLTLFLRTFTVTWSIL